MMSEGKADVLVIVPYRDPTFNVVTFAVCGLDDLLLHLNDDDPTPDEMYADGIVGAFQRAAIDGPMGVGAAAEELLKIVEKAGSSNSAEGKFTYWDKEMEET